MLPRIMRFHRLAPIILLSLMICFSDAWGRQNPIDGSNPEPFVKNFAYVAGSTMGEGRAFPIYGCRLKVSHENGAWNFEVSTPEGPSWLWSEPLSLPLQDGPWPTFEEGAQVDYADGVLQYRKLMGSEFFEPRELRLEFQVDPNFKDWKSIMVKEWRTSGFPRREWQVWTHLECLDTAPIEREDRLGERELNELH